MAERLNAVVLKTTSPQGLGGSNPPPSVVFFDTFITSLRGPEGAEAISLNVPGSFLTACMYSAVKLLKTDDSKQRRFLTEEECRALLAHSSPEDRPIFFVLLNTGMRRAEVANLEWSDINIKNQTLKIQRKSLPHRTARVAPHLRFPSPHERGGHS